MSNYMPHAEQVLELFVSCEQPTPLGRVKGGNGLMIPITGGTVKGPEFTGEVLPGGADWAIRYEDGLTVVDARYAIKAEDGTIIQVFNSGANRIVRDEKNPAPIALTTPKFIAPEGPHHWLNHAVFVGTLQPDLSGKFAVHVVIFKLV